MPELPDIENFSRNLRHILSGKKLVKIEIGKRAKLKDPASSFKKAFLNQSVKDVFRSGKEMRILFSNGNILGIHLMLTGDILYEEESHSEASRIAVLKFSPAPTLILADRMKNARLFINPIEKDSPDALDRKMNVAYMKKLCESKVSIKNILTNQELIRGIGSGYADEILWRTRISPYSAGNKIPSKKLAELVSNIKKVLNQSIQKISKNHPGIIHGEIKDYLDIHTKAKEKSPTGKRIHLDLKGISRTFYTDEQVLYK